MMLFYAKMKNVDKLTRVTVSDFQGLHTIQGMGVRELAERFGFSKRRVTRILRSPKTDTIIDLRPTFDLAANTSGLIGRRIDYAELKKINKEEIRRKSEEAKNRFPLNI